METDPAYTRLLYWQLKMWTYLLGHMGEIKIRADSGNPCALQIIGLYDLVCEDPTRASLHDLLAALDEYRRALLN